MFDLHYFDHSFAFSLRYCVLFDAWDLRIAESDIKGKEGLVPRGNTAKWVDMCNDRLQSLSFLFFS